MRSRLIGAVLMAAVGMGFPGIALIESSDDPPRRRAKQGDPQPFAKHEPEVLSKRAQRRARGKAKGANRGGR
jgi:hypothetical protein